MEFAAFRADLSVQDEVLALAERINQYKDVYGLVNNAGICYFEDFFKITPASYDKTFDINIKAVFLLTQKITEKMVEHGIRGRVVNLSSITSALGGFGITVSAVMPGPTPTKHNSAHLAQSETEQKLCSRMPMGSYGTPTSSRMV